jgi:hypothetical protein
MGCRRCEELLRLAEEAIEVHAQVHAQLAMAELAGNRVKVKRLQNLAKSTEQNREWAAAAYRTHAGSHRLGAKTKRAGSG